MVDSMGKPWERDSTDRADSRDKHREEDLPYWRGKRWEEDQLDSRGKRWEEDLLDLKGKCREGDQPDWVNNQMLHSWDMQWEVVQMSDSRDRQSEGTLDLGGRQWGILVLDFGDKDFHMQQGIPTLDFADKNFHRQ